MRPTSRVKLADIGSRVTASFCKVAAARDRNSYLARPSTGADHVFPVVVSQRNNNNQREADPSRAPTTRHQSVMSPP